MMEDRSDWVNKQNNHESISRTPVRSDKNEQLLKQAYQRLSERSSIRCLCWNNRSQPHKNLRLRTSSLIWSYVRSPPILTARCIAQYISCGTNLWKEEFWREQSGLQRIILVNLLRGKFLKLRKEIPPGLRASLYVFPSFLTRDSNGARGHFDISSASFFFSGESVHKRNHQSVFVKKWQVYL